METVKSMMREPHDSSAAFLELEHAVLGYLMTDTAAGGAIVDEAGLVAVDLAHPPHRTIFDAIMRLRRQRRSCDYLSVYTALTDAGQAQACGGLNHLNSLYMAATSENPRTMRSHVARLKERAEDWRARDIAKAVQSVLDGQHSREERERRIAQLAADLQRYGQESQRGGQAEASPPFAKVAVADLAHSAPAAPAYWLMDYVPANLVTLMSAHGGVGKSMLSLILAVSVALGLPFVGIPTRRGRVVVFSGEDSAELLRHRLWLICKHLGVDPAELEDWLHILDATGGDPVLFREVSSQGQRVGVTTATYDAMAQYFDAVQGDLLIIDNASDTFDAPEIQRAMVRGFMRALARIARERGGAVLLLAHIDKASARGNATGTDTYSGSTAWHNSARSRIALTRTADGGLRLEHQKNNLGRLRDPVDLAWPENGLPSELVPVGPLSRRLLEQTDTRALLQLAHEFYSRGEWIATAAESRTNASRMLAGQKGYPKRKPMEVFNLLRDAERAGLIEREGYRGTDRKPRQRWRVTSMGVEFINAAPRS